MWRRFQLFWSSSTRCSEHWHSQDFWALTASVNDDFMLIRLASRVSLAPLCGYLRLCMLEFCWCCCLPCLVDAFHYVNSVVGLYCVLQIHPPSSQPQKCVNVCACVCLCAGCALLTCVSYFRMSPPPPPGSPLPMATPALTVLSW